MKKTIKVIGLVLLAALFMACSPDAKEESSEKNILKPLFDPAETTVDASRFAYEDAKYVFRVITEKASAGVEEDLQGMELTEAVENYQGHFAKILNSISFIESFRLVGLQDFTEGEIAQLKAEGYTDISGKKATYYKECSNSKYTKLFEKYGQSGYTPSTETELAEYAMYERIDECHSDLSKLARDPSSFAASLDEFKKNADGTKYYGKETISNRTIHYYIMKK